MYLGCLHSSSSIEDAYKDKHSLNTSEFYECSVDFFLKTWTMILTIFECLVDSQALEVISLRFGWNQGH